MDFYACASRNLRSLPVYASMFFGWSDTSVMKFGEIRWAQKDGGPPATLLAGSAPGESGVSVLRMQFLRGAHFSATTRQHMIYFQISPHLRLECRMAGRRIHQETSAGALAICPAGIDCSAETDASADLLLVAIKPGQLALAAAEDSALEAQLNERVSGYDQQLMRFARVLASENAAGYPNGPLFWNEAASQFINRLVFGHTSIPDHHSRAPWASMCFDASGTTSWRTCRSRSR
jgi:AraC family transcriptional regulator